MNTVNATVRPKIEDNDVATQIFKRKRFRRIQPR